MNTEEIKQAIAKARMQNSQKLPMKPQPVLSKKPIAKPVEPEPEVEVEEPEQDMTEDVEEVPQEAQVEAPKEEVKEVSQEQIAKITAEIERLQNNGIFRAELLYQLQLLNSQIAKIIG